MLIKKPAAAGTMESSDCLITVRPCDNGNNIHLESDVAAMFGDSITATIHQILGEMQVANADISILDHGALDCVIRARLQCALCRSADEPFRWKDEEACHV